MTGMGPLGRTPFPDPGGLGPGLADPVLDSQAVFRGLLAAMAYPGRPVVLTRLPPAPPPPLHPAAAAVALTLFDLDTPVFLDAAAGTAAVTAFLRFHAGCPIATEPGAARFALIAVAAALPPLDCFAPGEDRYPDRSATVIVQTGGLAGGPPRRLSGPGIDGAIVVAPAGLPPAFWPGWAANAALYPRGIDVILTAGETILGLPRTARAEEV